MLMTVGESGVTLSSEEKELACGAINSFGSGHHPFAGEDTISGFSMKYLRDCCNKAVKKCQPKYRDGFSALAKKLDAAK